MEGGHTRTGHIRGVDQRGFGSGTARLAKSGAVILGERYLPSCAANSLFTSALSCSCRVSRGDISLLPGGGRGGAGEVNVDSGLDEEIWGRLAGIIRAAHEMDREAGE